MDRGPVSELATGRSGSLRGSERALIAVSSSDARSPHEGRAATAARATIMRARARVSLESLATSPARSLRADDRNQRATRLRNPFDRELAPRPGRIAADRGRAREPGDLREPGRDRARRSLAPRNLSLRSERGSRSNPPGSMNNDQAILTQWAGACGDREKEAARTGGPSLPRRSVGSTGCLSAGACGPSQRRTCARRTCPNRRVPGR